MDLGIEVEVGIEDLPFLFKFISTFTMGKGTKRLAREMYGLP